MALRYTRSRGRLGAKRESVWLFVDTVEATLSGAPTAVLANVLNAAALALRPFTIVRTRGVLFIRSDQVTNSETYGVDLGYAVVSEQASAIGVTAVPTPLTDKGSDLFFVYEQLFDRIEESSGAGTGVPTSTGRFMQYDSKAMRKVGDDEDVVTVLENELAGVLAVHSGRMLVKMH